MRSVGTSTGSLRWLLAFNVLRISSAFRQGTWGNVGVWNQRLESAESAHLESAQGRGGGFGLAKQQLKTIGRQAHAQPIALACAFVAPQQSQITKAAPVCTLSQLALQRGHVHDPVQRRHALRGGVKAHQAGAVAMYLHAQHRRGGTVVGPATAPRCARRCRRHGYKRLRQVPWRDCRPRRQGGRPTRVVPGA